MANSIITIAKPHEINLVQVFGQYAERQTSWREFIRSHTEVLAAVDFFTADVWTATGLITDYVAHFHAERNHQGKDNVILFPEPEDHIGESIGPIQTRERLGGLLKFYYREAA